MKEIQMITLVSLCTAAVLADIRSGKIPNSMTGTGLVMGLAYQVLDKSGLGIPLYFGGVLLPVVLLGILYYFRMIGAGDIKLLCMIGGFLGPSGCFSCLSGAVLLGGVVSLAVIVIRGIGWERWIYLTGYISEYSRTGQWKSYMAGTKPEAGFCFSVPVLMSVLWYVGKCV